jgi:hypothetical protein
MTYIFEIKYELNSFVYYKFLPNMIYKVKIQGAQEHILLDGSKVPKEMRTTLYNIEKPNGELSLVRETMLFSSPQEAFK